MADKCSLVIFCALALAMSYFVPGQAFATHHPSENCDDKTIANSTLSFGQFSNSTNLMKGFQNTTIANTCSNLSFSQYSNSTLLFGKFSNSTMISFGQFSNSTSSEQNNTLVLAGQQNDSNANDTNQTLSNLGDLFQFTSNIAHTKTHRHDSKPLYLQGDTYVDENSTVPNIRTLTVDAWVKPDYSQGSPVFTVASDTNEFTLAINNNLPSTKHATFSVFDGIKWTTVQSSSLIPQQWTYLAATYNGTTIAIYVNGSLENTVNVKGIPVLVDGELTIRNAQNLTSDANVTIGAYYDKTRQHTRDLFSGEIGNVNLTDIALTQMQVEKMYYHRISINGSR